MYKQIKHPETGELLQAIRRLVDMTFIPFDPDNTDYQAYLKWLEEGNTPEQASAEASVPADEVSS